LIGVRTAIVSDSDGFTTPDQFRTTDAKTFPATFREIGRVTVKSSIPAFHGKNTKSIPKGSH